MKKNEKKESKLKRIGNGIKMGGYFTVEAAMVLPVVIGTIVFIIYLQLFLYNRCLMEQDVGMLAAQAVKYYQSDSESVQTSVLAWKEKNLTDKHVGWQSEGLVLSKKYDVLKLEQEGKIITDHILWNAHVQSENRLLNVTHFLRSCRKVEKIREEVM